MTATGVTYNHKNGHFWQMDFTGKERDEETGYSYFGARYLDHAPLTLWLSVDPMADKYPSISPYAYCAWNPLKLVDPEGEEINPVYDLDGNFLGTDDLGLQGEPIIMDKDRFEQGMSHLEAVNSRATFTELLTFCNSEAFNKFFNHATSLSERPDWDGILTLSEANDWYRNGNGEPLYVDAAKIDLFPVTTGAFEEGEGSSKYINFAGLRDPNPNTGLVYGNIKLTLLDKSTGEVLLGRPDGFLDNYGFEQNPNGSRWRNFATKIGKKVAGKGTPFDIYTYNTGTVLH
ncbi:MAG: hypothetical protein K5864_03615 [Bacteroidales bacterium]|nr:hypothetical protein [Bacteroidales bacterium]